MQSRITPKGEIWGITTYFNPAHYSNKLLHLTLFAQNVRRQGLKLLVVELAFGDEQFVVDQNTADIVVRVKASAVMWQKERLLNLAMNHLPDECDKVVWLDADLLFGNPRWVSETSDQLDSFIIVQPYDVAWWLPPNVYVSPKELTAKAFQQVSHGVAFTQDENAYDERALGHWGFAWAARRSLIAAHGFMIDSS